MARNQDNHDLPNPAYCIEEARRLVIPVDTENWSQMEADAERLNILPAAIAHLVYLDSERSEFQQQVMEIVFTAYVMGQAAEERRTGPTAETLLETIESLDLSGLSPQ
jgi:hypothetical protein